MAEGPEDVATAKAWRVLAIGGGGVAAFVVGWLVVASQLRPAPPAREGPKPSDPAADRIVAERQAAADAKYRAEVAEIHRPIDARIVLAREVWVAFDKLPAARRNVDSWSAALLESTSHRQGLDAYGAKRFNGANDREARERAVGVMAPGGKAAGEDLRVAVPSPNRARCMSLAMEWVAASAELRQMGFVAVRCEAATYKSALTGKEVYEAEREWPLPE